MNHESVSEVSVSPVERFREYLKTKNSRLTSERRIVVEEVFSSHEHFDRETFVDRLSSRNDGRRVSRSTVHRALGLLEEAGLLRKVARANGRDVYEHDYGYPQHDHLICQRCGNLIEFHHEALSQLLEATAADHHFRMSGHRLEVYGICDTCSRPPQRRHRKLEMI